MSPNKMFFSSLQAQMPLNKIIKLWPQPENRQCCQSILDGYIFYCQSLVCHITLRKWLLHALSNCYCFNCQISPASENLPNIFESEKKRRSLDFPLTCSLKAFHSLSDQCCFCALSTEAALRDSILSQNTSGFVLKRRCIRAGFCNNEAAAVPQPHTLFLHVFVSDNVPVGIIAGGTVGSSILLLIFLLALAFFLYRQRKGSECTQSLSNVFVQGHPHTYIVCVCVSISLSFIHSLQLSFCFSWKKGTLASHIASDINEYSYNMANCLKTPTVHFPFNSFDLYL